METKQDRGQDEFLKVHGAQLQSSGIPKTFWGTLQEKLESETFDAGKAFLMTYNDEGNQADHSLKVVVASEDGLKAADPNNIFLVDHAWTYRLKQARGHLTEMPQLLDRMERLMGIDPAEDKNSRVDRVLECMWRYNQTYNIANKEADPKDRQPLWYILDEFGSCIKHSDDPSFRMVPFFYMPGQVGFSLLYPLKDLEYGDEVSRDYANHITDALQRDISLLPWQPRDMTFIHSDPPEREDSYLNRVCNAPRPVGSGADYPDLSSLDRKVKVFTTDTFVAKALTHNKFQVVDNAEEADVYWSFSQVDDYRIFESRRQYINQFPGESVIVTKDMLAFICATYADKEYDEVFPKWLPVTFDLHTARPHFVSYFQKRAKESPKDNIWMIKPYNLSRALDSCVSDNLNQIIRLTETAVPKVACQYITEPVLYHRDNIGDVKFDLRYIVLLTSVDPLEVYVYETFYIRFANVAFSNDHLDVYAKHYTVMNYGDEQLHQVSWQEFVTAMQSQYPNHKWDDVQRSIYDMIVEFFKAATTKPPPRGLSDFKGSRAMYGLDLMLKWSFNDKGFKCMQPMLLECNFCPDCHRAEKYGPGFFNDVFSTLFLNDTVDRRVIKLV